MEKHLKPPEKGRMYPQGGLMYASYNIQNKIWHNPQKEFSVRKKNPRKEAVTGQHRCTPKSQQSNSTANSCYTCELNNHDVITTATDFKQGHNRIFMTTPTIKCETKSMFHGMLVIQKTIMTNLLSAAGRHVNRSYRTAIINLVNKSGM